MVKGSYEYPREAREGAKNLPKRASLGTRIPGNRRTLRVLKVFRVGILEQVEF